MLLALPATLQTRISRQILHVACQGYPTLPYPTLPYLSGSILRYSLSAVEELTMIGP